MQKPRKRFIEIDYARSAAIILMIAYHLAYDLQIFYGIHTGLYSAFWSVLEKIAAGMFVFLSGLCFAISWESTPDYKKILRRGVSIFLSASLISIVTYLFDPSTYVRFGILHLIAVTMVLLPLFTPLRRLNLLLGMLVLWIGVSVKGTIVRTSLLLPFGFLPAGFESVDYFPLLPWFGVSLLGIALGYDYQSYRISTLLPQPENSLSKLMTAVSKRSLIIYLLHQPALLLILQLILGKPSF